MRKIVVRKSDNKVVSFGYSDVSRFELADYDILETDLTALPDELRFCKYENNQVVVDEVYKQQVLDAEAQVQQDREEAREQIKLEELAKKTYSQVDTYIDNNVTADPSVKAILKKLAKLDLALIKFLMIKE